MLRTTPFIIILTSYALLGSSGRANGQYSIVDLDAGTSNYSAVASINEFGQIVGNRHPDYVPFLWTNGGFTELRQYGNIYTPTSINSASHIAGNHFPPTANGQQHGFLLREGVLIDLGVLGFNPFNIGPVSQATAVNDVGQVVGRSHHALTSHHDDHHAFLWQSGTLIDLGSLNGPFGISQANAINNHGHVVGHTSTPQSQFNAFIWRNGVMTNLDAGSGGRSFANAINDSGQIVGSRWSNLHSRERATMWVEGAPIDLHTLPNNFSYALDINSSGQVVGYYGDTAYRAFIWQNGVMTDLNTLVTLPAGWVIRSAVGINDAGQIIGEVWEGVTLRHGVLLSPFPIVPADSIPPTTSATVLPSLNDAGWTKGPRTRIELHPVDNPGGSGVKSVTYQLQNFNAVTTPGNVVAVETVIEGIRWLKFHSEDNAGNVEAEQTITLKMDRTNPMSTALVNGATPGGPYYAPVSISLSATDSVSGVASLFYSVDGGPAQQYTGPFTVSGHGNHTVSYWAVDIADNVEAARSLDLNVVLDTISPTTMAAATPQPNAAGWINAGWRVGFTATDEGGSGVKSITYQVPDFPVVTTAGDNVAVAGTREGIMGIRYFAEDKAGNVEAERVITIKVDMTPPVTTAVGVNGNTGTVSLTATDTLSGVENTYYRIDGGAVIPYSATFQIFARGDHVVEYWSVDVAGNEETHRTLTVSVGTPRIRVDSMELSLNPSNPNTLVADITLTNISQVTAHLDIPSNGVTLNGIPPPGWHGFSGNLAPGETFTLTVSFIRAQFEGLRRAELAISATYDDNTLRASRRVAIP